MDQRLRNPLTGAFGDLRSRWRAAEHGFIDIVAMATVLFVAGVLACLGVLGW